MEVQDCAKLASRSKFSDYITLLRNATHHDFSLVSTCRYNICTALWGSGNPDISGSGMAVGYLIETTVCSVIVGAHLWYTAKRRNHTPLARLLLSNTSKTYYDTALFFNFAIQWACIITLARADWGMGADGMGGITMDITWLVSSLTLLPLAVIIIRSRLFKGMEADVTHNDVSHSSRTSVSTLETERLSHEIQASEAAPLAKAREEQRLIFFVICWALAFGPFYSRMGGTFGPSKIGDSLESVISNADWAIIEQNCFEGVKVIEPSEKRLVTSVGIISYFLISFIVLLKVFASTTNGQRKDKKNSGISRLDAMFDEDSMRGLGLWLVISSIVVLLLVIEFWAFFRFRRLQSDMVRVAGGDPPDEQWSFGQVVAITIFLPVLTEVIFVWRKRLFYLVVEHDESNAQGVSHFVLGNEEVK